MKFNNSQVCGRPASDAVSVALTAGGLLRSVLRRFCAFVSCVPSPVPAAAVLGRKRDFLVAELFFFGEAWQRYIVLLGVEVR